MVISHIYGWMQIARLHFKHYILLLAYEDKTKLVYLGVNCVDVNLTSVPSIEPLIKASVRSFC